MRVRLICCCVCIEKGYRSVFLLCWIHPVVLLAPLSRKHHHSGSNFFTPTSLVRLQQLSTRIIFSLAKGWWQVWCSNFLSTFKNTDRCAGNISLGKMYNSDSSYIAISLNLILYFYSTLTAYIDGDVYVLWHVASSVYTHWLAWFTAVPIPTL